MNVVNINIPSSRFDSFAGDWLRKLYGEEELSDVTLVCGDEQQLKAHKVILGSSSPVFRNIFKTPNTSSIYLRGIKFSEMKSILNFIYLGEVAISQDCVENFLQVAIDLRIKGLSPIVDSEQKNKNLILSRDNIIKKETQIDSFDLEDCQGEVEEVYLEEEAQPVDTIQQHSIASKKEEVNETFSEIPDNEERLGNKNIYQVFRDSEYPKQIITKTTVEHYFTLSGRDIDELAVNETGRVCCSECGQTANKRADVAIHILTKHDKIQLQCDECPMICNGLYSLQYHQRTVHEGRIYSCNICPYKGSTNTNLKKHVLTYH